MRAPCWRSPRRPLWARNRPRPVSLRHYAAAAGNVGPASSRQIIADSDANSRAVVVGPSRVWGSDGSLVGICINRLSIDEYPPGLHCGCCLIPVGEADLLAERSRVAVMRSISAMTSAGPFVVCGGRGR
jgi:hypothetical protein